MPCLRPIVTGFACLSMIAGACSKSTTNASPDSAGRHSITVTPPPTHLRNSDEGVQSPQPVAASPQAKIEPPQNRGSATPQAEREPPPKIDKCPDGMAPIAIGGCIDKYEESAGKGKIGKSLEGTDTTIVPVSAPGKEPLVNVTAMQAKKACANAKKHLCSEAEWRSACKNRVWWDRPMAFQFPYGKTEGQGPEYEPGRCNDARASESGKRGIALTGSFAQCVTPTGVYDLSGNVAEIVDHKENNGDWSTFGGDLTMVSIDVGCDEDDTTLPPNGRGETFGFRCCAHGTPSK